MQSENSRGNSASGDADSPCSLHETSRKTSDFVALTGPFGDHFLHKETSSAEMLFKSQASNSSTESEESDPDNLKIEYFQRLAVIREQMAILDIANKDYYANCFDCPHFPNQCTITELHDNDRKTNNCSPKATSMEIKDHNKHAQENNENEYLIRDGNLDDCNTMNLNSNEKSNSNNLLIGEPANIEDYKLEDCNTVSEEEIENIISYNNDLECIPKKIVKKSAKPRLDLEIKCIQSFENDLNASEEVTNTNDVLIEESTKKLCEMEIKSVLSFENVFNSESSMELMELNYNPPKKKPCIRDSTPRKYIFDPAFNTSETIFFKFKNELKDSQEEKINHIFPKVKIECTCGTKPVETIDVSCGQSEYGDLDNVLPNLANGDHLYVKFLDSTENSQSSRSFQSGSTEATTTIDSPPKKSKKRRLFLRSASNKVKPIDKMTLWEEIRTMEAIKTKNVPNASSSQESIFKKVLIRKPKPIQTIDLKAIGSLDIPRKSSASGRFPSITRLTKFCSSIFTKRSSTVVEEISQTKKVSKAVQTGNTHKATHHNKELVPKVAKALMDVRKEQRITVDSNTPSYEEHSEYSYQDDDAETFFQHHCIFCFCF